MKRQYECLYIISSAVKEDARKALVEKFGKMAAADVKIELWGMRKFATVIDHKTEGFYVLMNFAATPDVPRAIGDLMNITDGIVRYMFVCKDEIKPLKTKKGKKSEGVTE